MIQTDCYFTASQRPKKNCQDFSICGTSPFPYVILCDGCSSSDNTDLGARVLAFAAKKMLRYLELDLYDIPSKVYQGFANIIAGVSRESVKILGLNSTCLDSTLIIAFEWNKKINVFMYGDGAVFSLSKNGVKSTTKISYAGSAPYYPSYLVDEDRNKSYKEFANQMNGLIKTETIDGVKREIKYNSPTIVSYDLENTSLLLITSDGVESFVDFNTVEKVPYERIADTLISIMSIKSKKGEFIKRRSIRMFEDLSKLNIYNTDDFSVGALMVED